jgi:hypothetical protein
MYVDNGQSGRLTPLKLKEIAMDTRGYSTHFVKALAIAFIAAFYSVLAVPASAMPNMPHLFVEHEVARSGGDVAHASDQYRNNSRGYSGYTAGFYGYGASSSRYHR